MTWTESALIKLARLGAVVFLPTADGQFLFQEEPQGLRPPGGGKEGYDKTLTDTIIREVKEEFGISPAAVKKKIQLLGYDPRPKFFGNAVYRFRGHGLKPGLYQASNSPDEKVKLVKARLDDPRYVGPKPEKLITEAARDIGAKMLKEAKAGRPMLEFATNNHAEFPAEDQEALLNVYLDIEDQMHGRKLEQRKEGMATRWRAGSNRPSRLQKPVNPEPNPPIGKKKMEKEGDQDSLFGQDVQWQMGEEKSAASEMRLHNVASNTAPGEQIKSAKFHRPENWDRVKDLSTKDFNVFMGANDWENRTSGLWVEWPNEGKRVYLRLQMPDDISEGAKWDGAFGEAVLRRWLRLAREEGRKQDAKEYEHTRLTPDDFIAAAKGMKDVVKECGKEIQTWQDLPVKEAAAKAINAIPTQPTETPPQALQSAPEGLGLPGPTQVPETPVGPPKTGPDAIYHALRSIDLDAKEADAKDILHRNLKSKRDAAVKVLGIVDGLRRTGIKPHELMISRVPVIPPAFRPFTAAGDVFIPGDANELYRDLINMRDVNKQIGEKFGVGAQQQHGLHVYDAAKALYGFGEPTSPKTKERSVSGFLKKVTGSGPKWSFALRKMLSKPQDYVGRSVVAVNPDYDMNHIGLPDDMAWTLYAPYIQRRLVRGGMKMEEAVRHVRDKSEHADKALNLEMQERPVIYSRSPAWHKFSIVSGWPHRVKGNAIQANPFIASGMNLDYDGDCKMLTDKDLWILDGEIKYGTFESLVKLIDPSYPLSQQVIIPIAAGRLFVNSFQSGASVFLPVSHIHFHTRHKQCVRIQMVDGFALEVTDDHSLMTVDEELNLVQVSPKQMRPGMLLPVARKFNISKLVSQVSINGVDVRLDYNFGYLVGHYLGDGGAYDSVSHVRLMSDDTAHQLAVCARITQAGFVARPVTANGRLKGYRFGSTRERDWFRANFGNTSYNKLMPGWVFAAPKDFQIGMLDGLLSSDGRLACNQTKGKVKMNYDINISIVSYYLAEQIAVLGRCLGIGVSMEHVRRQVPRTGLQTDQTTPKLHFTANDMPRMTLTHPARNEQLQQILTVASNSQRGYLQCVPWNSSVKAQWLQLLGLKVSAARAWHSVFSSVYTKKGFISRHLALDFVRLIGNVDFTGFDLLRRWCNWVASDCMHFEKISKIETMDRQPVTFDVTVPATHLTICPVSGILTHQTMNVHVPAFHDSVEDAKNKLMPDKMLFSIKKRNDIVAGLKQEQVLGVWAAQHRPAKNVHRFKNKQEALQAIHSGKVPMSDEVEYP